MTTAPTRLIDVALPVPLFQSFTYRIDEGALPPTGSRVVVPLRTGREIGVVLGAHTGADAPRNTRAVLEVPDAEPALSPPMLDLCRWIADYYVVPLGLVVRAALPALLTGAGDPTPARRTRRVVSLRGELPTLTERDRVFGRGRKQRQLYELLESLGGHAPVDHLLDQLKFSPSVLDSLAKRELVSIELEEVDRDPFAARPAAPPKPVTPTAAQQAAIAALLAAKPGDPFLLYGVTGSGKTLVYIELLRDVVERRGQTAIVLVPEIALTPQTVERFRAVFGDRVAVLHSALSDGERYDAWRSLKRGDRRIAVGARSAIFAPLENLGAIVVDEEHEPSYKQGETPRYHAREVAVLRAQKEGAVLVLGSATPSLESWENARTGKYRLLRLPDRVAGGRLPEVEVVDLRKVAGANAASRAMAGAEPPSPFELVFSPELEDALSVRLELHEQSILLLNRRGYSAFVQCSACGDVVACPNCSISLTYHRTPERLVCHYCLHQEEVRSACAQCGGATLRRRGMGTQQVERMLIERFPSARIARMDVDTTSGKWAHAEILDRVGRGEVDILMGTQMIAKGLDFPNVTLVGAIDADVGINLPDFRASERTFQLLAQVAGRAGRGPKGGRVLIQTRVPKHHAVRCAVTHDYESFVREEMPGRISPAYPPTLRLANVLFTGLAEEPTADLARDGADWLHALIERHVPGEVQAIGPAPCPIERIQKRWRWHVMLKSANSSALGRVARYFMTRFPAPQQKGLRIVLDRDPVTVL